MEHLKDIELIELSAGRAEPRALERMQSHLDRCAECSERLRQIIAVDDALEDWRIVEAAPVGLVSDVLRAVQHETARQGAASPWGGALRLAASLVLSVSVGHLAARTFRTAAPPASITVAEVEDSLQLAALSQVAPVGLTGLFMNGVEPEEVAP